MHARQHSRRHRIMAITYSLYLYDLRSIRSGGSKIMNMQFDYDLRLWYTVYMKTCMQCGKSTNNPKFCNLSCAGKYQKGRRPNLVDKTVICLQCNVSFQRSGDPNQKFCSRSCSASYNNKGKNRHGKSSPEPLACEYCNATYYLNKVRRSRFCSMKCSAQARRAETISKWLDGAGGTTAAGLSAAVRRYLIEQANEKCQECGWGEKNPVTGRAFLEVEHIDGNYLNNRPENLKVLCPNCHSLTPTYKALNTGNGRAYRGKYDQYSLAK